MAYESVLQPIQSDDPELFFGIVSAVGTPVGFFLGTLKKQLEKHGYEAHELRLSGYPVLLKVPTPPPEPGIGEFARINTLMDMGDEARRITQRGDILALFASSFISSQLRPKAAGTGKKRAYIFRQLKHPDEVYALREIYGDAFHLLGLYSPRKIRHDNLVYQKVMDDGDADILMNRDEYEAIPFGQNVRGTFHLSDVFIKVDGLDDGATEEAGITHFLELLFGASIRTPTADEYGMYLAAASAVRSAQLARQVGAAILSGSQEVLALGCNEVPRFGGGQYWQDEAADARDHQIGIDSNDQMIEDILTEIVEKLTPDWAKLAAEDRNARIDEARGRLANTRVASLTEFGRAVHAEMDAILSAGRNGVSLKGATLYTTTFPCHNCTKHIIAAGVDRVVYVEPYPKSLAAQLHKDAICLEQRDKKEGESPKCLLYEPFVGIGPRRYVDLFSNVTQSGIVTRRKDESGKPVANALGLRLRSSTKSYLELETFAARWITEIAPPKGK
jgi:deoxycytidylate deaminase